MRDGFENPQILDSKPVTAPKIKLKPGLLQPGGYYLWKVRGRDVNENSTGCISLATRMKVHVGFGTFAHRIE